MRHGRERGRIREERSQVGSVREDAPAGRVTTHLLHRRQHLGPCRVHQHARHLLGAARGHRVRKPAHARREGAQGIASSEGRGAHGNTIIGLHRK